MTTAAMTTAATTPTTEPVMIETDDTADPDWLSTDVNVSVAPLERVELELLVLEVNRVKEHKRMLIRV
eukprot:CAMPEP_0184659910 /NCGR_PEP_ID=MMETSP0308-20130426/31691_1 /TAXON_ID=38269 /ORGANISM="Gloeochaete witrockiana, Strain SAG 46.84" /LENGTH=67 /DNA_ID=CAMNT_0027100107 /DNA_START=511 /DNA_END=714 /DNA_ORIENTATION=+